MHAHRVHNEHTDALSHSLSDDLWAQVIQSARKKKTQRDELHFAVIDVETGECFLVTISFRDPLLKRNSSRGARAAKR